MATNKDKSVIRINGEWVPAPKRGLEIVVSTNVNAGRNANGEVIGQVVGRNIYKLNNLEWPLLKEAEWNRIMQLMSGFFFVATFPDPVNGGFVTLKCYPGDRTASPYWLDVGDGKHGGTTGDRHVLYYQSCKVNIIDCGIIGSTAAVADGTTSIDELGVISED